MRRGVVRVVLLVLLFAPVFSASAREVNVECADPGSWRIAKECETDAHGVETIRVTLDSDVVAVPPKFTVKFAVPQVDIRHVWNAVDESYPIPADWSTTSFESQLAGPPPLYCFLNGNNRNRLTLACSEASRVVRFAPLLHEEDSSIRVTWTFFERPEAGLRHYEVTIRLDARDGFWSDSVHEASAWVEKASDCIAAVPPPAAFDPLYSSWYCFHQDVTDSEIEAECRLAAAAGMKTLILDDGWQTDDTNRGYGFCGDWEVSRRRFPDMAAHVAKVRQMGFKYMMWYSMPFVGFSSKAYPKFDGKYLYRMDRMNAAVLDPRFPEVRDYLAGVYETAMREWDIDGFKFDFINRFTIPRGADDPALAQNYAGRDFKSVTAAVDCLMTNVMARLQAIKPDVLVEFRQPYFSTEIRKYCNMLRATDCPGDGFVNRMRIVNLRLVAGKTAVHADMLEWHPDETVEKAARYIVDSLFSVVQYSMMIRRLPESHRRMMTHWIAFQLKYRDTLLKGDFKAWHPEAGYPLVEASDRSRRILAVYNPLTACELGADGREALVVNGTGTRRLIVLSAVERNGEIVDTLGKVVGAAQVKAGANVLDVPEAGYVRFP